MIVAAAQRDEFLALMQETYGEAMSREEFDGGSTGTLPGRAC